MNSRPSFALRSGPVRLAAMSLFSLSLTASLMACGGGGGGGAGGASGACAAGGSSGQVSPGPLQGACGLGTRIGQFSLSLLAASGTTPAYTQFSGAVYDRVDPSTVWLTKMTVGSCSVLTGPTYTCATKCTSPQICVAQDTCGPSRTVQDAGAIMLRGLGCPRTESPAGASGYFDGLTGLPYPPATPGAAVSITAAGATAAFTLSGQGVEPLQFDGSALTLVSGQDLAVSWTPPNVAGGAQTIKITIDAAHHGGTSARLECVGLPDTGAATIDGGLIAFLISQGVAGFPTIDVTRQTADSTTLATGCVDFTVASTVSSPITVCQSAGACVKSCNCGYAGAPCLGQAGDVACAAGTTCQSDLTCQ